VDKNKRVYGGVPLLGLSWPRAYGRSAGGRSYEASLTPQSRGYFILLPPPFRSSISFRRRTRCRDASAILWSCSWIRSSKPSDVFLRCADHVSMFCSRSCVRLQRGSVVSFGSSAECEPDKPFIELLQTGHRVRPTIWWKGRSVVSVCASRPVGRRLELQLLEPAERTSG